MNIDLNSRLERLLPLVRQASELALSHFGRVNQHDKPDGSIVTEADALTEHLLVDGIKSRFPGETIIGEELGCTNGDPRFVWSIDPIDGTAAYASRLPFWCVSVGLMIDNEPVLGVVSLPVLNEVYYASKGNGAYMESDRWGKEKLCIPADEGLSKLGHNSMVCAPSKLQNYFTFDYPHKVRSFGSTAIHALLVARHDAISAIMRPFQWDVAGAIPILLEAGGQVETYDGEKLDMHALLGADKDLPDLILGSPEYIAYTRSLLRRKCR